MSISSAPFASRQWRLTSRRRAALEPGSEVLLSLYATGEAARFRADHSLPIADGRVPALARDLDRVGADLRGLR